MLRKFFPLRYTYLTIPVTGKANISLSLHTYTPIYILHNMRNDLDVGIKPLILAQHFTFFASVRYLHSCILGATVYPIRCSSLLPSSLPKFLKFYCSVRFLIEKLQYAIAAAILKEILCRYYQN